MADGARLLGGIEVLDAVVEAGSFGRAATALGLTQSGVSRAIARLEARVGVRLFERTARTTALTEEGRRFHARVAPLLVALENAATHAGAAATTVRGRLRINVDALVARLLLAPRIGDLLLAHPDLAVEIVTRERLGDLVAEGFDAAVRFGEPEPSALIARKLLETRVLTVASPAYLAHCGHPTHPRELARHACIQYVDPATGRPFDWEFTRGGKTVRVAISGRLTVNDVGTKLGACLAGYGIAQVLAQDGAELRARGELVELFPAWAEERFPLYVFHVSRRVPPARLRAFVDFVVAAAR